MDHFGQIVKFWLFLVISCKFNFFVLQKSLKKHSQHIIVIFD